MSIAKLMGRFTTGCKTPQNLGVDLAALKIGAPAKSPFWTDATHTVNVADFASGQQIAHMILGFERKSRQDNHRSTADWVSSRKCRNLIKIMKNRLLICKRRIVCDIIVRHEIAPHRTLRGKKSRKSFPRLLAKARFGFNLTIRRFFRFARLVGAVLWKSSSAI